jgi:cardiolipin synthase
MALLSAFDVSDFSSYVPHITILAVATVVAQLVTACHCILNKRDSRAAIAWVGFIWLVPALGVVMYAMFGINRIRRKARSLRRDQAKVAAAQQACDAKELATELGLGAPHLANLVHIVGEVTGLPLLCGNRVTPLVGPAQAYPVMLDAIRGAQRTVALQSYIFNNDATGQQFADALEQAVARGVEVRVLIDDVGSRYKLPAIVWRLRHNKVTTARFLPAIIPMFMPYYNLRSHRKILVVDGSVGFTGGMNIRDSGNPGDKDRHAINDLHFKIEGPVIDHMMRAFAEDWDFTTHESLDDKLWRPKCNTCGDVLARGIADGPDEDRDKLRLSILGALACARHSVRIVTPYFLPDAALITALAVTRLRGVDVQILLPAMNNLRTVQWASTAQLWQVLEYGCRVWLTPPPFDHTKLMLVDGAWTLLGSGNWDARSLRLNFEFDVECYDIGLHDAMMKLIDSKLVGAHELTLKDVDSRRFLVRLRDGIARLASPYL